MFPLELSPWQFPVGSLPLQGSRWSFPLGFGMAYVQDQQLRTSVVFCIGLPLGLSPEPLIFEDV